MIDLKGVRNVLVLMPDKHMGNLVVSIPAMKALRDFFYGRGFRLVVDSSFEDIVRAVDGLDDLLLFPRERLNRAGFPERFSIFYRFLRELRLFSPDLAIDLQGGHASSILTLLSGAPLRVGRETAERPYVYNVRVKLPGGRHKLYSYREVAETTGAAVNGAYPVLTPDERAVASMEEKLLKNGVDPAGPIVCIHPGAGKVYKRWTAEGFSRVSDWLSSSGYQVVFIGGGSDLQMIEDVRAITKEVSCSLGGDLSLGELMALFGTASLYIGNDSGPMHLADASGTPVVALFGPADEKRWGPVSSKAVVLRGEEPCPECKGKDCRYDFKCIRTLTVDRVKDAVRRFIEI